MTRKRPFWLMVAVLLAGCAAPEEPLPPPAPEPPPPVARYEPPPAPEPAPEPELCAALASLMAGGIDGFDKLRGQRLAAERWRASAVLPGTERCTIEGEAWPRSRFSCDSQPFGADNREVAHVELEELANEIDACLAKPIWSPRNWQKGQLFQFAMGERLQSWTDPSTSPPTAVTLKLQRDLMNHDYRVELNLEAVR